eukprot:2047521-Rhodomonas_salina.6
MPGTVLSAMRYSVLTSVLCITRYCRAVYGADLPTHVLQNARLRPLRAISLRPRYAIPGTDVAYGATRLPRGHHAQLHFQPPPDPWYLLLADALTGLT